MKNRTYPNLASALALALALIATLVLPQLASAQEAAMADMADMAETPDDGMTAETLVEKNLEAKGGKEKIESVESARIQGKMNMQGMEAPFTLEWKAPDMMRMEMSLQGMTLVQAFDGETGWMINPFMGKTAPEKMSDDDAEMFKDQAEFHGPLVDYQEKGYTLTYEGEEDVEGTPTYKLKVVKPSGEEIVLYLDQEYFLEIKQDGKRTVRGQEIESSAAVGDYKEVDGLVMAHSLDVTGGGGPGSMNMTFENVELNPELSDDEFAMPAAEEAEEGAGDGSEGSAR
jgi:outer membrane lipoprotein-sorting protein